MHVCMIFSIRFTRSRPFLYAFTVSELHILQHCLIKCMSCRNQGILLHPLSRFVAHFPIKLCRVQGFQPLTICTRISSCAYCSNVPLQAYFDVPKHLNACKLTGPTAAKTTTSSVMTKTRFRYGTLFEMVQIAVEAFTSC